MSVANTALVVADLDFFSIRDNIKNFLRSQDTFQDYDFDGSGMSVLIDALAYNTYYNSFYMNMLANESYLDTAQIRKNILSHAKAICYVPNSSQGALSLVNITVTPSTVEDQDANVLTIDKYTRVFGADKKGVNYPFVTLNSNTVFKQGASFNFANVYIKQGEVVTLQFPVDPQNTQRRYQIPSANVDMGSVIVSVQESSSNTYTTQYNLADDLTEITGDSPVYYMEEDEKLNYTIYFGDGVLGRKPKVGNIVIVTYLDNVGSVSNNITRFSFVDPIGGKFRDNIRISTIRSSYGGTDKEDVDTTRFRAPWFYTAQNRAVTVHDYESTITKNYNNIDSVSIWGGEDNDPVVYGKVYLSLKTKGYYALTNIEKQEIKDTLIKTKNVLTIIPEIIDPDYSFLLLRGKVYYDPNLTSCTSAEIEGLVKQAVGAYNRDELGKFKSTFRKARLQYYIENCEPSITGSDIEVYMQKRLTLTLGQIKNYDMAFNTQLRKGDYYSKLYTYPQVQIRDSNFVLHEIFFDEVVDSFTGIDSIRIINPGINYLTVPQVTIIGDGSGATAVASLVGNRIKNIAVTNKGTNYTQATVVITSDSGSQATAEAVLQQKNGILEAYYYKNTGEKIIVNANAGSIDYSTGKIQISNLAPLSVLDNDFYDPNVFTVNVVPEGDIIMPLRNRILAIDENNYQSIQIKAVAET